jgi:hypothetical protein
MATTLTGADGVTVKALYQMRLEDEIYRVVSVLGGYALPKSNETQRPTESNKLPRSPRAVPPEPKAPTGTTSA